ncbi:MAG: hypothetical protein U0165_10870 [Polyangiaceae bacterium]
MPPRTRSTQPTSLPAATPAPKAATATPRNAPIQALPPVAGPTDRREALELALTKAIAGNTTPLFTLLARNSGLPGARHNEPMLEEFVQAALAHGAKIDALLRTMATLDADVARGDTEYEFVPVCAVHAIGARAATVAQDRKQHAKMLSLLHDLADDLRFRVRDAVVFALLRIGPRSTTLLADLAGWTIEHFFQASVVIRLLAIPSFLETVKESTQAVARLDEAFVLARDAPRSSVRYPGYKALIDALSQGPSMLSTRFATPAFDLLERWAATTEPPMRAVVESNLAAMPGARRHGEDITRVRKALEASAAPLRDPTHYVGPTRKRGKNR